MIKMTSLLTLIVLSIAPGLISAMTTTFDPILVAHGEPSICPSPSLGVSYTADAEYLVCCDNGILAKTRTTAKGPGGKTVYACCRSGDICTGAAPVMSDWSLDVNGRTSGPYTTDMK